MFLNEEIGYACAVATCLTVIGSTIISRPKFLFPTLSNEDERPDSLGIGLALVGSVMLALDLVVIKRLKDCHPLVLILAFCLGGGLAGVATAFILFEDWVQIPNLLQVGLITCVTIVGLTGQVCGVYGAQNVAVSFGAVLKSSETIFAYIFQVIFLAEPMPDLTVSIGVVLVISAIILIAVNSKKESNLTYRKIDDELKAEYSDGDIWMLDDKSR